MTSDMTVPDAQLVEAGARALAAAREDDVFTNSKFAGAHWGGNRDIYREDAATVLTAAQTVTPPTPVAELLRAAAAGRREYAVSIPERHRAHLEAEAVTLDLAAQVADGNMKPLYGWLPSWRWTDEMNAALNAATSAGESR